MNVFVYTVENRVWVQKLFVLDDVINILQARFYGTSV